MAYEALESSGDFGGASEPCKETGCYVGVCGTDYNDNVATHNPNAFSSLGTLRAFLTGKISHYFGWTGPSITCDTACSSSAVAIHAACKALQVGECARAVAGGVSLFTSPYFYQNLAAASFLSPTGPTKSFDATADGYCRGEGVGLVVLKKLSSAIAEGDNILGVIIATAVNQCSNTVPITVPHSPSQINLFKESIRNVFGGMQRLDTLHVGSVKANIGHTEGASGVAALIKTILMMQHRIIPAQTNFKKLSPKISALEPDKVAIPVTSQRWDSDTLIACVNNYGAAGSIAAMVVCQSPPATLVVHSQDSVQPKHPIIISAKSPASLRAYCIALRNRISHLASTSSSGTLLANVSFALASKQNLSFPNLFATTATTLAELDDQLKALESTTNRAPSDATQPRPIVLAFGGQTSRFVGLTQETYNASSLLRIHLDHCDTVIRSLGYKGVYPDIFSVEPQENIANLHAMQFALQYSCAMAWIDCGLQVDRLIGHSFGQLTALTISGSLSLIDGLKLVSGRASLMQKHWGSERGTMMALEAHIDNVSELMSLVQASGYKTEIACYNGPRNYVLVGAKRAIQAVEQCIAQSAPLLQRTKFKTLNVTHGFHSKFTEPALSDLLDLAESLTFKQMKIPLETCSDKHSWTNPEPKLIVEHTRTPVYFGQAVERIAQKLGPCTWIEAGSNSSITAMVRRALSTESSAQHTFHTVNLCNKGAMGSLADTIVDLWKSGNRVQFWLFHRSQKPVCEQLDLPPYQFEKTRHWLEWSDITQESSHRASTPKDEKREPTLLSFVKFRDQNRKEAEFSVDPRSEQYRLFVQGHRVLAQPLCPAPLYIELVSQATLNIESTLDAGNAVPSIEKLEIKAPLGFNQDLEICLLLNRLEGAGLRWRFTFYSQIPISGSKNTGNVQEHATGIVILRPSTDLEITNEFDCFQRLVGQHRCEDMMASQEAEAMQGALIYKVFSKVVHYSEYYEGVRRISSKGGEVGGLVALPCYDLDALDKTTCNPLAIDNFIQVAGLHVNTLNSLGDNEVFVCTHIDRVQPSPQFVFQPVNDRSWVVFSNFSPNGQKEVTNDIFVFDSTSRKLVFIILGARFMRVIMSSLAKVLSRANSALSKGQTAPVKDPGPVDKLQSVSVQPNESTVYKDIKSETNQKQPEDGTLTDSQKSEGLGIERELRNLLSKITDVPVDAFRDDSTMEDLGIDSLMVMEITTEIRQVFGIDIPQTDLQDLTDFSKLLEYLCFKRGVTHTNVSPTDASLADQSELLRSGSTIVTTKTSSNHTPMQNDIRTRLVQLLASHLETSPSNLVRNTNLADQGLDSLLCIEISSDIMKSFGVAIDITQLTTESTFGDLWDMVTDTDSSSLTPSSTREGSSAATTAPDTPITARDDIAPRNKASKPEEPGALVSAQQAFDRIRYQYDTFAKETGFFDFWKLVYPSQAQLVLAYVVEAFSDLDCSLASTRSGERIPAINVLPKHEKLVHVLYEILQDASLIEFTGAHFIRSEMPVDITPASKLYHDILSTHPKNACEHELLNIMGSKLAQLLTGTADPLQLLFGSKKNRELLEDVYTNGPMYEAITKLLGSFLSTVFSAENNGRTFHILELGGGTGSTTKHVLEVLVRSGISFAYTFSDLSPQLVAAGKRKFAKYDFMDYMVLNIEKPPPEKYIGHFHVILSTNCIHATRNLKLSLIHIRQMLRGDGFMSLVEFTKNLFWFDLVFGLLEGWWLFEDGRKHVIAEGAFWEKSMKAAGFNHVTMTDGTSLESRTLRIITGFPASCEDPAYKMTAITSKSEMPMETLAYKVTEDNVLCADLYYPVSKTSKSKRPVGMILSFF